MQLRNSSQYYGLVALSLHWAVAALAVLAWVLGILDLPKGPVRQTGEFVHMSVGLAVFLLVGVRLIWRFIDPPPPAEKTPFGRLGDLASAAMHWLLYVLILAVILFGVAAQFADGGAVPFFGLFQIVSPWIKDHGLAENLEDVHEVLSHGFMIVAGLHAAAALVHHFLLRDSTLTRMLPLRA